MASDRTINNVVVPTLIPQSAKCGLHVVPHTKKTEERSISDDDEPLAHLKLLPYTSRPIAGMHVSLAAGLFSCSCLAKKMA